MLDLPVIMLPIWNPELSIHRFTVFGMESFSRNPRGSILRTCAYDSSASPVSSKILRRIFLRSIALSHNEGTNLMGQPVKGYYSTKTCLWSVVALHRLSHEVCSL